MTGMADARLRWITVFGLGHLRPASGTWGSLPPVIVAALLAATGSGPAGRAWLYYTWMVALLVVFAAVCIFQGDRAEARYGKDPAEVVADETAGMALTLLFVPALAMAGPVLSAFTLVYAFLAFRIMDIFKPWPAGRLQRVPGGWGILLDDLFAGLYAGVLVLVMARVMLPR